MAPFGVCRLQSFINVVCPGDIVSYIHPWLPLIFRNALVPPGDGIFRLYVVPLTLAYSFPQILVIIAIDLRCSRLILVTNKSLGLLPITPITLFILGSYIFP